MNLKRFERKNIDTIESDIFSHYDQNGELLISPYEISMLLESLGLRRDPHSKDLKILAIDSDGFSMGVYPYKSNLLYHVYIYSETLEGNHPLHVRRILRQKKIIFDSLYMLESYERPPVTFKNFFKHIFKHIKIT